jgi:hypothetical protein
VIGPGGKSSMVAEWIRVPVQSLPTPSPASLQKSDTIFVDAMNPEPDHEVGEIDQAARTISSAGHRSAPREPDDRLQHRPVCG